MLKHFLNDNHFRQFFEEDPPSGGAPAGDGTPPPGDDLVEYEGHKIPAALKEKISQRVAAEKGRVESKLNERISEYETKYTDLEKQFKELKTASMTDKEKLEHQQQEREKELEELKAGKEQAWGLFKKTKQSNDIYSALSAYDVHSPKQVVRLLESYGKVDVVEKNGEYVTTVKINGEEMNVDGALKSFFDDPENSNLLKGNLRPGAGSGTGGNAGGSFTKFSKSEMETNPEMKKAFDDAIARGETPALYD